MNTSDFSEIKAMEAIATAIDPLSPEERARVLQWAGSKYGATTVAKAGAQGGIVNAPAIVEPGDFEEFADLHTAVGPKTDVERALVAGYWVQVVGGEASFASQTLNTALKDLGHGVTNITAALRGLQSQKPALVNQLKKAGTSRQARKTYKLTKAGITRVEQMLTGKPDEE